MDMNLLPSENLLGRQRCRQWIPLLSQQCRLRHVFQVFGLNFPSRKCKYYFTLHLTSMSAPFYTSERVYGSNPKWSDLDGKMNSSSSSVIVLRVWEESHEEMDIIVATWGVNFSGLVYLGNKLSDIEPNFFINNTIVFLMRGGYFTIHKTIKQDLLKPLSFNTFLNAIGSDEECKVFRQIAIKMPRNEVKVSYNLEKLRKLRSLQVFIKNKTEDVQNIRDKINIKYNFNNNNSENESSSHIESKVKYVPQLLTMNTLNKMLHEKPTKLERREMIKINKEIEWTKFISKLLHQERDSKLALIRQLKEKLINSIDKNEEQNSLLMENYHDFHKEIEKLKEFKTNILHYKQLLNNTQIQLQHRRKQLLQELLEIYAIERVPENKYLINGVYLPNSDILTDCSDVGFSVALGYTTHVLIMCSTFLQVPLRYPMTHYGSRSYITDQISSSLADKDRDFPLYTKGTDKIQFTYAVYLLNKNIAQLRWIYFMNTPELKATLPNLLTFLNGKDSRIPSTLSINEHSENITSVSTENLSNLNINSINMIDTILDSISQENNVVRNKIVNRKTKDKLRKNESGPGLSEILAIPEAFMNKQISSESFKNFIVTKEPLIKENQPNCSKQSQDETQDYSKIKIANENCSPTNCDIIDDNVVIDVNVEQGTDSLDPSLNLNEFETQPIPILNNKRDDYLNNDRLSKSLDISCDDKNNVITENIKTEHSSEQIINTNSDNSSSNNSNNGQIEFLEEWINNTDEDLYHLDKNTLTVRTDALLTNKTFNLVKPKY